jgi:light-regulated signal transduction histidine kinase (bacteriophytochrome)
MTFENASAARAENFEPDGCDREPIRIPGSVQPHGALIAITAHDRRILHASSNVTPLLLTAVADAIGASFADVVAPAIARAFDERSHLIKADATTALKVVHVGPVGYNMVAHRSQDLIIIEFEKISDAEIDTLDSLYPDIQAFVAALQELTVPERLSSHVAHEVRKITGFDRVMIYKFDRNWNGTVIAEDRNEVLPSYMDLRFPASDIPAQARELYHLNRLRLIADAAYEPVPVFSSTGADPLDMSFSVLRSVSPVHLEYMRNMGTASSMSISIVVDDRLWGLISCHGAHPRRVPMHVRTACDFLGQMYSLQLLARERGADAAERVERQGIQSELLSFMAGEANYMQGLLSHPDHLLRFVDADGAAVVYEQKVTTLGSTPAESDIWEIVDWLATTHPHDQVFSTSHLSELMPEAASMATKASGLLAVSISQIHPSYVMWFRKEVVQTVRWGGDPRKETALSSDGRLHPRRSFEAWKETVKATALAWSPVQRAVAGTLRNAIIGIVMRKAEELATLTEELRQSNKELEAFSYSVSHDLRAPFRHIVGYAELLKEEETVAMSERGLRFVDTIIESAFSAGKLVDDLLSFSQMSRSTLSTVKVNMNRLVKDVQRVLSVDLEEGAIEWHLGSLDPVWGDPNMLRQVLQNLIENAIKYSRKSDPPVLRIWSEIDGPDVIYAVKDNGVGFDMAYVDKLFGVFQRLHRMEEYEGTGIGLANVRRIVERHRGRTWAEGQVGQGATFYFALPRTEKE